MIGLLRRELRVVLWGPGGLFLVAVWLFLAGSLFMTELFAFEQAEQRALALNDPAMLGLIDVNDLLLASVMNNLTVVLLFLGPLVALRHWSDGASRDWLLHKSPSVLHLVVVRALAGGITMGVLVGVTLAFPAFLAAVGRPAASATGAVIDLGQTLTTTVVVGLAGLTFFLVSAVAVVAVEQPLAGAVVAFITLVLLWLLPTASLILGPTIGPLVAELSPSVHLEPALRGVVDVGDLLYWLLIDAAAIAAMTGLIDLRRR